MEFSFNTFFGYEQELNQNSALLIFFAMLFPLVLMIPIAVLGWIFRKLQLNMYFIHALLYTLGFTFLVGTITIFCLYFLTDKNGVKLMYCWICILLGMFSFCIINTNTLTKMFQDWMKVSK
ncbi:hypothetical protein SAMN05443633_10752 [Chryseobacterium arachidis]|uniref:Uncharacterized protein n=2 Tax=Chryseobacterium arachidis TaxID=1416778 RepID=A0A1M5ETR7_9FLAO|nr:hypothetical protein [Chryseobacterium arachidis]SHF82432.1 hypothetical protein SAMN05443633_10752 [Chryseobacterium arachidis]